MKIVRMCSLLGVAVIFAGGMLYAEPHLVNGSVRGSVRSGEKTLILGFVVQGGSQKEVVIRAVGPGLVPVAPNLAGKVCEDPRLVLYKSGGVKVSENNDWDSSDKEAMKKVGAFALPDRSKDAVIVLALDPGAYTVHTLGTDEKLALVEVYDADPEGNGSHIVNLSLRGFAGTGDNALIPGFVIGGYGNRRPFLLRAAGPTLSGLNVTDFARDPRFAAYTFDNGQTVKMAENDDWGSWAFDLRPITTSVGAFPFSVGSKDSAAVVYVNEPRSITYVIVDGIGGVVLGEIYDASGG